uniref:Uncharacterized protein n=1 Tax=Anguilla anguilla TaxID=7936 RepID=A0A0E9R310_ANGAN
MTSLQLPQTFANTHSAQL